MSGESTVSIPESVPLLNGVLRGLEEHPALSVVSIGKMIELSCCGTRVDVEAFDCPVDAPSRVYWPPRWTCVACFTVGITGYELVEVGSVEVVCSLCHADRERARRRG
jgi:hypothetical protein